MALIGASLIVASLIYVCVFPHSVLKYLTPLWRQARIARPPGPTSPGQERQTGGKWQDDAQNGYALRPDAGKAERDRVAMPPPPIAPSSPSQPPSHADGEDGAQTTPKATAAQRHDAVPTFSLSSPDPDEPEPSDEPPTFPARFSAQRAAPAPGLMAPPPPPPRVPSLAPIPSRPSTAARNLPIPSRGPPAPAPSSSLVPPPTHSSKPTKPSRKVVLAPGHSPLDWARVSGPDADLRNLPPSTPYLRVTPSMLKRQTGRKGKDAWTALGGRVYNITPYLPFHPGGEPELLRCAGRDGNRLFGEVHPWVNYETMLSACLVGILVDENDGGSKMDEMD